MWTPDFKAGTSFNFAVYDPEQHITVSLWDRDLLSQDDLMGETAPTAAIKAIMQSEQPQPLLTPGEEGQQVGSYSAKARRLSIESQLRVDHLNIVAI